MENNENQVTNSEEIKEVSNEVKTYTEAEVEEMKKQMKADYEKTFDEKFNKRWGREKSKIEQSYAKTNELVEVLKKGTQKDNIDDILAMSYETYNLEKPKAESNNKDAEILGKYDAKEFLDTDDYSEIEFEANRLAEIPNRTAREQATFMELANYLTLKKTEQKRLNEIEENGLDKDVYKNAEFQNFLSKFRDDIPLKDVYAMYEMSKPKKEKPFTTGSLTGTNMEDKNAVKEFYTEEEAKQFTKKDFDKNPALWKAIQDSMAQWYK